MGINTDNDIGCDFSDAQFGCSFRFSRSDFSGAMDIGRVSSFVLIRLASDGTKVRPMDFFVVWGPDLPDPIAA